MNIKPKINRYLRDMNDLGLLSGGQALELGCGSGADAIFLAQKGYEVTAIDIDQKRLDVLKSKKGDLNIEIKNQSIEDFVIEKEKYSLIIANNVLPFVADKVKVEQIIKNMSEGLCVGGKMCFTLFGPKDAWFGKPNMSFFEYENAIEILKKLDLQLYHQSTEEGYGKTMKGDIKFWHIHRFLYVKK